MNAFIAIQIQLPEKPNVCKLPNYEWKLLLPNSRVRRGTYLFINAAGEIECVECDKKKLLKMRGLIDRLLVLISQWIII